MFLLPIVFIFVFIFQVVISYTPPKPTRGSGSHKYSCSFFIVDPSEADPSQSVNINFFFNDLTSFNLHDVMIGDILVLRYGRLSFYNLFPQFTGNVDKCVLYCFHNRHNYLTNGLYSFEISPLQSIFQFSECNPENETNDDRMTDEVDSHTFQVLSPNEWNFYHLGKLKNLIKNLNLIDNRSVLAIKALSFWGQELFLSRSLVDHSISTVPPLSVHDIFRLLAFSSPSLQSFYYDHLHPKTIVSEWQTRDIPMKCDLICLVIHLMEGSDPPASSTQQQGSSSSSSSSTSTLPTPTSFLVWDGTSNGKFQSEEVWSGSSSSSSCSNNEASKIIQQSLNCSQSYYQQVVTSVGNLEEKYNSERFKNILQSFNNNLLSSDGSSSTYLGMPLFIQNDDYRLNHYLNRFKPGSWIRIRNLYLQADPIPSSIPLASLTSMNLISFMKGKIRHDTHIGLLEPYFW
jgi:hypothetical protein